MAEHKHGEMDIETQKKTFDGFVTFTVRSVIVIAVLVVLLAFVGA